MLVLKNDKSEIVQYDSPDSLIYAKRALLSSWPAYHAEPHWHEDIEFIAALSGCMDYRIGGATVHINEGDGLVVNSGRIHSGFSAAREECDFICVLLNPLLLCVTREVESRFVAPLTDASGFDYLYLDKNTGWQRGIIDKIKEIVSWQGKETGILRMQSLFFSVLADICENAAPERREQRRNAPLKINALKSMLSFGQEKYGERISLADIAAAGNVCKSKCCAIFREQLRKSPVEYLNEYRLNKSVELLTNTDKSILEIAYDTGFSNSSYFTEIFGGRFGCTPSQYRKRAQPRGGAADTI